MNIEILEVNIFPAHHPSPPLMRSHYPFGSAIASVNDPAHPAI